MNSYNQGRGQGRPSFNNNRNSGPKQMFPAICDNCGRECEVPFRPSGNKPVFCSDCFEGSSNDEFGGGDRSFERRDYNSKPSFNRDDRGSRGGDDRGGSRENIGGLAKHMEAMNTTLNRILKVLESQQKVKVVNVPNVGIVEKAAAPKAEAEAKAEPKAKKAPAKKKAKKDE
jgi:CxxC-x17-CxxC domain-containing protein